MDYYFSLTTMQGTIVNYRMGRHHQNNKQMVVVVEKYSDKEKAEELVGKSVKWVSPAGKELKGKISAVHGNSGAVRVIFDTGMPGQSVGTKVQIE